MTIRVGDEIIEGRVFVAEVNPDGLITKIEIRGLGIQPLVIDINPTSVPGDIADAIAPFLALLPH